ncbi:MAG: hypothetical protein ACJAVV_000323 [Alphaproteobacteria bacterium]|jgi:hypothetical protein
MNKQTRRKFILAGLCIIALTATAVVTAMQISLDAPASLPSDI